MAKASTYGWVYTPKLVERLYEKWFSGGDPLL
jgi:hypothetical protein